MQKMSVSNGFHSAKKYPDPVDATVFIEDPALSSLGADDLELLKNGMTDHTRLTFLGILGAQDIRVDPDAGSLQQRYPDFAVDVSKQDQGVRIEILGAPGVNFDNIPGQKDQRDLVGLRKRHLAAAVRDLVFSAKHEDMLKTAHGRNRFTKLMLQNAGVLEPVYGTVNGRRKILGRTNAWGGHHIGAVEYDYVVETGEQLGHDGVLVTTGGGPGTMRAAIKGNMTGLMEMSDGYQNYIEHGWGGAGRYGYTVPEIIAASEPPNKYIHNAVVLPEVEPRLTAFICSNHGTIIFPGGAGTAEEFMILLAVKMHENNEGNIHPFILTAPEESRELMEALDAFIVSTLGEEARQYYSVIIGDPDEVSDVMNEGIEEVRHYRNSTGQSFMYNDTLYLPSEITEVFETTHESMRALNLTRDNQEPWQLAGQLRRLFKSIVRGSIIDRYRTEVAKHGPYELTGDAKIVNATIDLLDVMDRQERLSGSMPQDPCYKVMQG